MECPHEIGRHYIRCFVGDNGKEKIAYQLIELIKSVRDVNEDALTRTTRIDLSDPSVSRRVGPIIKKRQQGKCHYCNVEFGANDVLISCGNPRSYYHRLCAKKIHII